MFFFRRPAICALTVTAVTLSCGLAARAQVGVTLTEDRGAVGVTPMGGVAPIGVTQIGAAAVEALGGVNASFVDTGLLLLMSQVAQGQMTLDEAWNKGLLDAPKVLQLLGQSTRFTEDESNEELQSDLAGLLVRLAPATVATPEKLSARVRVALCRYYSSIGDARAVPLCEALIKEKLDGKQINQPLASNPDGGSSSLYLSSVILLAQYYQNVGQWQKAGETWERVLKFWQDVKWFQAGVRIDAARAYTTLGQDDKAQQLYAQVAKYGNGWYTGLVLYDRANTLINQGDNEAARRLLTTPVTGQDANQIQIAIESLLSLSYYKTGDLALAEQHSQKALQQASTITIPHGKGLEATSNIAEAIQNWSAQWDKTPISVAKESVRLVLAPQESNEAMVTRHLFVQTLRDVPLTATVDDKRIQVHFNDNKQENDYFVQKELILEVPQSIGQSVDATLTVSSPQFPAYQVRTPIHVEVLRPIQLSSSSVFFGEVKANEPTTRTLTLSAAMPFRVLGVKTDTSELEVQSPATQAAKEQIITLIFTAPQVGRFYSGTIHIQTDVPNEEVIEVPYVAHLK